MNYHDQEKFLQGSRISGGAVCLGFLMVAGMVRLTFNGRWRTSETVAFLLASVAAAVLMYYTPDYLHLSVAPQKKRRWEINLRWRIAGTALLLGLLLAPSNAGRLFAIFAGLALAGINWLALKKVPARNLPAFFWITDLLLLFLSLVRADAGSAAILLIALAAAAHVAIVRRQDRHLRWVAITLISGMVVVSFATGPLGRGAFLSGALLLLVATLGTAWLVHRARQQNEKNIAAAMGELIAFTGYPEDRIQELWATSNQQLAANWQRASLKTIPNKWPTGIGKTLSFISLPSPLTTWNTNAFAPI